MTPAQLAEWKTRATRPRRTVPIVLDGSLRGRIEAVQAEVEQAEPGDGRLGSRSRRPQLDEELEALRLAAQSSTLLVVLEGMPGTPYRALLAAHPPREGDAYDRRFGADMDGIRRPIVQATIIGQAEGDDVVPLDPEFLVWLLDFVTDLQMDNLVNAALEVCRGDDAVPLPRTRSTTPNSVDA